jgi:hypothetical protein
VAELLGNKQKLPPNWARDVREAREAILERLKTMKAEVDALKVMIEMHEEAGERQRLKTIQGEVKKMGWRGRFTHRLLGL